MLTYTVVVWVGQKKGGEERELSGKGGEKEEGGEGRGRGKNEGEM